MRIVNRHEFLAMPAGTLYTKYESGWNFGELAIKYETGGNDWTCVDIVGWPEGCDGSMDLFDHISDWESGWKFDLECSSRDGLYEDDQLFAVYDKSDIESLVHKLTELTHLTVKT